MEWVDSLASREEQKWLTIRLQLNRAQMIEANAMSLWRRVGDAVERQAEVLKAKIPEARIEFNKIPSTGLVLAKKAIPAVVLNVDLNRAGHRIDIRGTRVLRRDAIPQELDEYVSLSVDANGDWILTTDSGHEFESVTAMADWLCRKLFE